MKCKFCGYESTEEFKECPKCKRRVLSVFTEKKEVVYTSMDKGSDNLKGVLIGLAVSLVSNALIIGVVFGISIVIVGGLNLYGIVGFIIIIGSYIFTSTVLGFLYNKLFKSLGLSNHARVAAIISYTVIALFIFTFLI